MSEPYVARPLRPDDLDGISRIHWRACRVAYRFMGWPYTEDEVRRWYAGKLREWDWGRVACDPAEGAVVAFAAAIGAHLDQLFVDPAHPRRGLGRALLMAALARGLRPATPHVFAENPAGAAPLRGVWLPRGRLLAGGGAERGAHAPLPARMTAPPA
ncbi:MAG TPA: GNAT family N-acetyltransferase [Geminicoccaceae bacterium]|nr:GNAT family N-acetyltransferase [Geminicoccaceae bacterium]